MNDFRYILDKGSKKHICPNCIKKRFVWYVDTETGDYLPDKYGRCDSESKCAYQLNPYKDGYAKIIWEQEHGKHADWKLQRPKRIKKPQKKRETFFIPVEVFNLTRSDYEKNVFIQNLLTRVAFPFKITDVEKVISLYNLGTCKGAITFPFIDINENVRAIQVKQFDEKNHTTGTDFLHSIIERYHTRNNKPLPQWIDDYKKNELKVSCLFGEHLLSKYPTNPIALVEAPKTAIYGALYFGFPEQPESFLWLAVYSLSSLNLNKCKELKGRNVYLFPDLSEDGKSFKLWSDKAIHIQKHLIGSCFYVSDLLERKATEKEKKQGLDLADYLIKQDWRLYRKKEIQEESLIEPNVVEVTTNVIREHKKAIFYSQPKPLPKKEVFKIERVEQPINVQHQNWSSDISELETYFSSIKLPTLPVKLNQCSTVLNVTLFIKNHFVTIKLNNGNPTYLPYLIRLKKLKQIL